MGSDTFLQGTKPGNPLSPSCIVNLLLRYLSPLALTRGHLHQGLSESDLVVSHTCMSRPEQAIVSLTGLHAMFPLFSHQSKLPGPGIVTATVIAARILQTWYTWYSS